MTRVRHSDLAAFFKSLGTLYAKVDLSSLSDRVTRCLHELFRCEAAILGVSPYTVHSHVAKILARGCLESRFASGFAAGSAQACLGAAAGSAAKRRPNGLEPDFPDTL